MVDSAALSLRRGSSWVPSTMGVRRESLDVNNITKRTYSSAYMTNRACAVARSNAPSDRGVNHMAKIILTSLLSKLPIRVRFYMNAEVASERV